MSVEIGVTSARGIIFEIARDLKTFVLPSKVRCFVLHTFQEVLYFTDMFCFFYYSVLL